MFEAVKVVVFNVFIWKKLSVASPLFDLSLVRESIAKIFIECNSNKNK